MFSLKVVFRATLWLEGSALPRQVKHPSAQVRAAGCVCDSLGFTRQVSAAQELVPAEQNDFSKFSENVTDETAAIIIQNVLSMEIYI